MNAHIRDHDRAFCHLCPWEGAGVDDTTRHLEAVHGEQVERWPDGAVVIDMSGIAEDMVGGEETYG